MDVIVVGSGLLGLTSAYYLAEQGFQVQVIDRQSGPALETSFANGGLLTPSLSDPWNAPGVFWHMLKSINREESPLLLRPAVLPSLATWGLRFLHHSSPARYQQNILRNTRMAAYNLRVLNQLRQDIGLSSFGGGQGTIKLCRDQAAIDHSAEMAEFLSPESIRFEVLDRQATFAREPALQPLGEQVAGAVYFPDDQFGNAHQFCSELAAALGKRGIEFHFNTAVTALRVHKAAISGVELGDEYLAADRVVLAAGSYSPLLAKTAGVNLPIRPCKGYSLTLPTEGLDALPHLPVIDDALHAAVVPLGSTLRVAGTAEFSGYDTKLNPQRLNNLFNLLEAVYPQVAPRLDRDKASPWTGLRPVSASGVPLIGATAISNLYVNAGHGHLGWSMAAGSGKLLADLVAGQKPEIDATDYAATA